MIRTTGWSHPAGEGTGARWRLWGDRSGGARQEAVEMQARRFGYQPWRFRWRGSSYCVGRIERVWEQGARAGRAARRYFAVICGDGARRTLYQDLGVGTWHVKL